MTFLEMVILILVAAFVFMVEICVVLSAVGRLYDAKTKAKIDLTCKLWEKEMEYIDRIFDEYMTRIEDLIKEAKS